MSVCGGGCFLTNGPGSHPIALSRKIICLHWLLANDKANWMCRFHMDPIFHMPPQKWFWAQASSNITDVHRTDLKWWCLHWVLFITVYNRTFWEVAVLSQKYMLGNYSAVLLVMNTRYLQTIWTKYRIRQLSSQKGFFLLFLQSTAPLWKMFFAAHYLLQINSFLEML